ncbi:MAG: hypothetical protein ACW98Y_19485 [Candidatus Thorarchaeota archaeon]|jgi:hypothetical protein
MKFALNLETQTMGFYENASKLVNGAERKQVFISLKDGCAKRIKTLERIRRENVTEMILEPIKGLDSDSYSLKLEIPESPDDDTITELAKTIEETRKHFYEKGSLKIDFLIEAATAFDRLADENQDNIDTLQVAQ